MNMESENVAKMNMADVRNADGDGRKGKIYMDREKRSSKNA
eukprot:CAMPEP_0116903424 /NCGR_PEP_ID=MMETSP0467-20121206/10730_1 /TAXON_ID=283647 /ORGANISM="Mesodinium pulex, Strain SPMC105" /LENGTH=40 /DNA_ID= /DNA_START= /DNA_END= /DNA_ORIENTATION=